MYSDFIGAMVWFTGVIEDIQDPEQLGRVRVRCYGYHTENAIDLPTDALPWAIPITPVTSASISGIGESATGLLPGSWVVGFFRDGETAQDPVIIGSIPSTSSVSVDATIAQTANYNLGFVDPSGKNPRNMGEPDIPKMATQKYDESDFYVTKKSLRTTNIPLATKPSLNTIEGTEETINFNQSPNRATWNTLDIAATTKPVYPYNHVKEYGAGHLFEVDETVERERICRTHKSGTYDEYTADGSRTLMVKGDDYKVIFKDEKVYIKGNCNLTIDADCNTYIKGDYNLEVEKDFNVRVGGSLKRKIQGNKLTEVGGDQNTNISENEIFKAAKDEDKTILGERLLKVTLDTTEDIDGSRFIFVAQDNNQKSDGLTNIESTENMHLGTESSLALEATQTINEKSGGTFKMNGSQIYLN